MAVYDNDRYDLNDSRYNLATLNYISKLKNLAGNNTIGSYLGGKGGWFNMTKAANPFSKASLASLKGNVTNPTAGGAALRAGISAAAGVAGTLLNKGISGGLSSGAGNAIGSLSSTIGGAVGQFNPLAGAAILLGGGVFGGLVNRTWGTKTNQDALRSAIEGTNYLRNFRSNASSFDEVRGPGAVASFSDPYKGGWISGKKARRKNAALREQRVTALNYADRSVTNNVKNIASNQMNTALTNYAALGGLFDNIDHSSPIGYALDTFNELNKRNNNKGMMSPLMGMPKMFAFGGNTIASLGTFPTGLTHVNTGGTHEENPEEGVQMGVDNQGVPNLVEEGEVVYDDYVFSNRLTVPNYRSKYKKQSKKERPYEAQVLWNYSDMTFADAAKKIEKNSGSADRPNDSISRKGMESDLEVLADVQEKEREKEKLEEMQRAIDEMTPEELAMLQQQMAAGLQLANQQAMAELQSQMVPQGMEQMVPQELMRAAYGGPIYALGGLLDNWKPVNKFAKGGPEDEDWYKNLTPAYQAIVDTFGIKTEDDYNSLPEGLKNDMIDLINLSNDRENINIPLLDFRDNTAFPERLFNIINNANLSNKKVVDLSPEDWLTIMKGYGYTSSTPSTPSPSPYHTWVNNALNYIRINSSGEDESYLDKDLETIYKKVFGKDPGNKTPAEINADLEQAFNKSAFPEYKDIQSPIVIPEEDISKEGVSTQSEITDETRALAEKKVARLYKQKGLNPKKLSEEGYQSFSNDVSAVINGADINGNDLYINLFNSKLRGDNKINDFNSKSYLYNLKQNLIKGGGTELLTNDKGNFDIPYGVDNPTGLTYIEGMPEWNNTTGNWEDNNKQVITEPFGKNTKFSNVKGNGQTSIFVDDKNLPSLDVLSAYYKAAITLRFKDLFDSEAGLSNFQGLQYDEQRLPNYYLSKEELANWISDLNQSNDPRDKELSQLLTANWDLTGENLAESQGYKKAVADALGVDINTLNTEAPLQVDRKPGVAHIPYLKAVPYSGERYAELDDTGKPTGKYINWDSNNPLPGFTVLEEPLSQLGGVTTYGIKRNNLISNVGVFPDGSYMALTPELALLYKDALIKDPSKLPQFEEALEGYNHKADYYDLSKDAKTGTHTEIDTFPRFRNWPYWLAAGVQGAALGYNLLSPKDYSNVNALLAASAQAGNYMPISFEPIGDYLPPKKMDIWLAANALNALTRATDRNLMNISGGNRGVASANMITNNYKGQLGFSDLLTKGMEYNDKQDIARGEFNKDTNKFNSEGFLKAAMANQDAFSRAKQFLLEGTKAAYAMKLAIDDARANSINAGISGLVNLGLTTAQNNYNNRVIGWLLQHNQYPVEDGRWKLKPGTKVENGYIVNAKGGKINKRKNKGLGF